MIAEAATQFNAKAIAELYPSGGPVKTVIVGEPSEEMEEQAKRVKDYMNYQITQEMPEYFPDLDQMLFQLPLVVIHLKSLVGCKLRKTMFSICESRRFYCIARK